MESLPGVPRPLATQFCGPEITSVQFLRPLLEVTGSDAGAQQSPGDTAVQSVTG